MMRENLHAKSYAAASSPLVVDLRQIGNVGEAMLVFEQANFDIEVVSNTAAVTVTGTGPFSSSTAVALTDGAYPIGGAKKTMKDTSLGALTFTSSAVPFTVNIIRKILD
jgi:hypothetical protein